jgi:hypothetical protein
MLNLKNILGMHRTGDTDAFANAAVSRDYVRARG